jgi:hypothetical protein
VKAELHDGGNVATGQGEDVKYPTSRFLHEVSSSPIDTTLATRATRIQFDPFKDHYAEVCRTYVTHDFARLGAIIGADVYQEYL